MEQNQPFSLMDNVYAMLSEILTRRWRALVVPKHAEQVQLYFLEQFLAKRFYLYRTVEMAEEAWHPIRISEPVLDFILGTTNELRVRLAASPMTFQELSNTLASAYGQYKSVEAIEGARVDRQAVEAATAIDSDLFDRLPTSDELRVLYIANPWLVTLLIAEHLPIQRIFNVHLRNPDTQAG